jgi:hypothetical protein
MSPREPNRITEYPADEATMTASEPIYDVAHLGHVEPLTNKPEAVGGHILRDACHSPPKVAYGKPFRMRI